MSDELVLLHICCGPCAIWPVDWLRGQGFAVDGFWFNPNVHPRREYQARLDSCRRYAAMHALTLHEQDEYGLQPFLAKLWPQRVAKPERCEQCYIMRLEATARKAAQLGVGIISTTLQVSPFQDHLLIEEAGRKAAAEWGVRWLQHDWRGGFQAGRTKSRLLELYQQSYCGCLFSEDERYRRTGPRTDTTPDGSQVRGARGFAVTDQPGREHHHQDTSEAGDPPK